MRPWSWVARWKGWCVRIVAGNARLTVERPEVAAPIATGAPVCARFPITVRRAVAASAERRAVGQFQLASVAGLKDFEISLVVAVEAEIVAIMAPVPHDDVLVLVRNNEDMIGVKTQRRRLLLLVASIAIEVR